MNEIITALGSSFIGGVIGGLIAIYAAFFSIRRTEYYRLSALLREKFRGVILQLDKITGHPASVIENNRIDALVDDVKAVIPSRKRKTFDCKWKEYRYDKQNGEPWPPSEYTKMSTVDAKKLIQSRLHDLIFLL